MTKRNQTKEKKTRRTLYERHGHLIGCDTKDIPSRHRCITGGLRCFRKIHPRDGSGNKLTTEPKIRCGKSCSKGSLYCNSHGGANARALVAGTRQTKTLEVYKGIHNHELQDLMMAFINDPKILDMKAELVTVRTMLMNYMKKVAEGESVPSNPTKKLEMIEDMLFNDNMTKVERLMGIKEITDSIRALDDGPVIDRVNRCVETVGKTIDRIHKIETKNDFMLTPEGLKIILRGVVDVLKEKIEDEMLLRDIKEGLQSISTKTKGDLSKYHDIVQASVTVDGN